MKPIPEKLVVLTFDDGCRSHATVVGPLLKKYGCGGTIFVSDAFSFRTRKDWYMTWQQIKDLDDMGFEIGNHTVGHGSLGATSLEGCTAAATGIEDECRENRVSTPTTFCWPFYNVNNAFCAILRAKGYLFARGGGERPYRPTVDCPFDAPSFSVSEGDVKRDGEVFYKAVKQATAGQVVIITFHGVPDMEHPTVGLAPERFEGYLKYLKENHYHAIAMRDLAAYVDTAKAAQLLSFANSLPWGGPSPAWGSVSRQGNQLYLCVKRLPADRKLTVPDMTVPIAKAYFLADPQQRSLEIAKADTGIQTVVVPDFAPDAFGTNPTVFVAELRGGPAATILDFVFPGMPEAVISGNEIRVRVPQATDLTKLAPIYRTGSPLVTGQSASGTALDFTNPQTYTITAPDGSTRKYVVTVSQTPEAVGFSDHGFEKFEAFMGYNNATAKNASSATWQFIQPRNDGEVGIRGHGASAPVLAGGGLYAAYMRGPGNGIAQTVTCDKGRYTIGFDVVKRTSYEATAAPLNIVLDGVTVFSLPASRINESWSHCTSPALAVTAGAHTFAFILGEGGMDLLDNVVITRVE